MGVNSITTIPLGDPMRSVDVNQLIDALKQAFVGRNASGVAALGQELGTVAVPWGTARITSLVVGGNVIDFSGLAAAANRLISSRVRTTSNLPDFIRADGSAAEANILATATPLVLSINGVSVTVSGDINVPALTTAPVANNTCQVNDTNLSGQEESKYQGEDGTIITIDAAGTEITNRVGQYAAFKNGANEIFLAFIKSSTELTNVFRGFYFNSSGNELRREVMANNDVLTIQSLGWMFIEDDGATVDVTYTTPVYDFSAPGSPATGDYWFDTQASVWKRYNGTSFVIVDRILLGQVVIDTVNCFASRSVDFAREFSNQNNIDTQLRTTEIVESTDSNTRISVYGIDQFTDFSKIDWNITIDLEFGAEASDTMYYLYLSDEGERIISIERPQNRLDLKGWYHPFQSWRCISNVFNDSSNDFEFSNATLFNDNILTQNATAIFWLSLNMATATINNSYNISSVTDLGVGFYDVFYERELSGSDYAMAGISGTLNQSGFAGGGTKSTQFTVRIAATQVLVDVVRASLVGHGDFRK